MGPSLCEQAYAVALETALGGYAAALQRVLADCAAENPQFSVVWEEDTP